jgi:hypothetical protein
MKINLDKQFKKLSGEDYAGDASHMGKVLAEALSASNKGNSIKLYSWALKLFNKEELELDGADHKELLKMIESSTTLNNLCKAQLLSELEN